MTKRLISFILLLVLFPAICQANMCWADMSKLNVATEDGVTSTFPYKVKFSNGTVTDNGDGTTSVTTSSSGVTTVGDVTTGSKAFEGTKGSQLQWTPAAGNKWEITAGNQYFDFSDTTAGREYMRFEVSALKVFFPQKSLVLGNEGSTGTDLSTDSTGNFTISSKGTITFNQPTGSIKFPTVAPTANYFVQTDVNGIWTYAAGGSTNPAGTGSEVQYRSNGTTFGAVTNSSVSGANVTLGGSLTLNQNAQPSLVFAPTGVDQKEDSWDGSAWTVVDKTSGQALLTILNTGTAFLTNLVLGSSGVNSVDFTNSSGNLTISPKGGSINISSLTSNGFVKTGSGNGTLSVDTNTYLTGNQTITLTSDVTGSGTTSIATTLKNTGTAGTYRSTTFDAQGRETSGTNPTTFSGYGLSDTSTNLRAVLSDPTGTGSAVFGTSPTFNTGFTISGAAQLAETWTPSSGDQLEPSWDGSEYNLIDKTTGQILLQILNNGYAFLPGNNLVLGTTGVSSATLQNSSGTLLIDPSAGLTTIFGTLTANSNTQSAFDNSTKIATTAYVDSAVAGQNYKEACKYASTAALPAVIYSNGVSGVGATLAEFGNGALSVDGSSPAVNDRVLIKNQASTFQNGLYSVTATGSAVASFVLTRTTDANMSQEFKTGDAVLITSGSTLSSTTWGYTGVDSPTMGTTALTYAQTATGTTITTVGDVTSGSAAFEGTKGTQLQFTPPAGDIWEVHVENGLFDLSDKTAGLDFMRWETNGSVFLPQQKLTLGNGGNGSVTLSSDSSGNYTVAPQGTFNINIGDVKQITVDTTGQTLFNKTVGFRYIDNGGGVNRTIDWTQSNDQKITLNGNATLTFTAPANPGHLTLIIVQDSTGSRTITWPTVKWAGSAAPTLTTTANGIDIVTFFYDGATYYGAANTNFG